MSYTSQFVKWYLSIVSCISNMGDNLKMVDFISQKFINSVINEEIYNIF